MAYVWDVYARTSTTSYTMSQTANKTWRLTFVYQDPRYVLYGGSQPPTVVQSTGKLSLQSPRVYYYDDTFSSGFYAAGASGNTNVYYANSLVVDDSMAYAGEYVLEPKSTAYVSGYVYGSTSTTTYAPGALTGTASGETASYPANGYSGTSWYIRRDKPASVSYAASAAPGASITVSWSGAANPVYYRLQRRLDGGAWTTLSSALTETSYTDSDIASNTTAGAVEYQVCTLGESAASDYTAGGVCTIARCSVWLRSNGAWAKASATYQKAAGVWTKLDAAGEAAAFAAGANYQTLVV